MSKLPKLSTAIDHIPSCNLDALRIDDAQQLMQAFVENFHISLGMEVIGLQQALGRVLAKDLISPIDVPIADNSAMDGYAFNSAALKDSTSSTISLKQIGTALAGKPFLGNIPISSCVRIMTGAIMPSGCDTTIPQELVRVDGEQISFSDTTIKPGDNRRLRGEDLFKGQPAILAGKIIRPADLGLIASLGIPQIEVYKKLRVGFLSTGTEIRSLGQALDPGSIYDSNRYTIFGMLSRLGVEVVDFGVLADDPIKLRNAFHEVAASCDAVITSGGVSVGEVDYTKQIMQEMGDIGFWKLAIRPGRPMAFGSINTDNHQCVLFGLPGNPVATMVTFYQLVQPTLLRMAGASVRTPPVTKARLSHIIRKSLGRTEFQRGTLSIGADGMSIVTALPSQGSGVLSSMSQADCLIILGNEQATAEAGDLVDVLVFEGLI